MSAEGPDRLGEVCRRGSRPASRIGWAMPTNGRSWFRHSRRKPVPAREHQGSRSLGLQKNSSSGPHPGSASARDAVRCPPDRRAAAARIPERAGRRVRGRTGRGVNSPWSVLPQYGANEAGRRAVSRTGRDRKSDFPGKRLAAARPRGQLQRPGARTCERPPAVGTLAQGREGPASRDVDRPRPRPGGGERVGRGLGGGGERGRSGGRGGGRGGGVGEGWGAPFGGETTGRSGACGEPRRADGNDGRAARNQMQRLSLRGPSDVDQSPVRMRFLRLRFKSPDFGRFADHRPLASALFVRPRISARKADGGLGDVPRQFESIRDGSAEPGGTRPLRCGPRFAFVDRVFSKRYMTAGQQGSAPPVAPRRQRLEIHMVGAAGALQKRLRRNWDHGRAERPTRSARRPLPAPRFAQA